MDMEKIRTKLGAIDINAGQNSRHETQNYDEKANEFFNQYFKTEFEKEGRLMIPRAFLYKNPMPDAAEPQRKTNELNTTNPMPKKPEPAAKPMGKKRKTELGSNQMPKEPQAAVVPKKKKTYALGTNKIPDTNPMPNKPEHATERKRKTNPVPGYSEAAAKPKKMKQTNETDTRLILEEPESAVKQTKKGGKTNESDRIQMLKNPEAEARPMKNKNKSDKDHIEGDAAEHMIYECLHSITHDKIIAIRDLKFNLKESKKEYQQDFIVFHSRGVMMIESKSSEEKTNKSTKQKSKKKAKEQLDRVKKFFDENFNKKIPNNNIKLVIGIPNLKRREQKRFDGEYYYMFKEDVEDENTFRLWWQDVTRHSPGERSLPDIVYKDILDTAKRYILYAHLAYDPDVKANENNIPIRDTDVNNVVAEQTTSIQYLLKTPEQREVSENKTHILNIEGPAGSGKTVLLEEKVRSIKNNPKTQNDSILVLCYHRPLAAKLETNLGANRVTVSSFIKYVKSLQSKKNRAQFQKGKDMEHTRTKMNEVIDQIKPCITDDDKYDHILIDEGQDFKAEWREFLKRFILKDPNHGYFWMFYDSFQRVENDGDAHLNYFNITKTQKLTKVMRTTKKIHKYSCKYDPRKSKLGHKIQGVPVEISQTEDYESLKNHLNNLIHQRVKQEDITVLFRSREKSNEFKRYCREGGKEKAEEEHEEEDDDLQEEEEHVNDQEQEEDDDLQEEEVYTQEEDYEVEKENVKKEAQYITSSTKFQNAEEKAKGGSHITLDGMIRFKGMEHKYIILFNPKVHRRYPVEAVKDTLYTAFTRSFCILH
ncbi:unnamed protein product, partial [Owenia fusiformis]